MKEWPVGNYRFRVRESAALDITEQILGEDSLVGRRRRRRKIIRKDKQAKQKKKRRI